MENLRNSFREIPWNISLLLRLLQPRRTCVVGQYIEKDSSINEHIEQMRLSAPKALLERPDSIIVATVSAIYGLGDPAAYLSMVLHLDRATAWSSVNCCGAWQTAIQTQRNGPQAGHYRVRGDVIDVFPAESEREAVRVELGTT